MKVLLFDCESFPNISFTWGYYEQNVIEVIRPKMVCSISWQWYPSRETHVLALPDFSDYDREAWAQGRYIHDAGVWNNRSLIDAFNKELKKADVAVGHNIDEFDDKMVNTDIVRNDLEVPPLHRSIDTLKVVRNRFRFNSNKLDDVCQELDIGKKLPHPGFPMWKGCMRGEEKSWDNMKRYNVHDVHPLLRGLYERIRPWVRNHPNVNAAIGSRDRACPTCKSKNLKPEGWRFTQTGKYQRHICRDCGSWCKGVQVGPAGAKTLVFRPM